MAGRQSSVSAISTAFTILGDSAFQSQVSPLHTFGVQYLPCVTVTAVFGWDIRDLEHSPGSGT